MGLHVSEAKSVQVGVLEDDFTGSDYADGGLITPRTLTELAFLAGPTQNDLPIRSDFPFLANPHNGYDYVKQLTASAPAAARSRTTRSPSARSRS